MSKAKSKTPKQITPEDVSRVQRAVAKKHGGQVPKGNHVGRMQRAAARHHGKPGAKKPA